jgi:transposase InsO family protein
MNVLYQIAGMSRQNYHKKFIQFKAKQEFYEKLREVVIEVRKEHPKMGARKMHKMLQLHTIGINSFECFVSEECLGVQKYRSQTKTTRRGHINYPNLTYGLELDSIDQLWASDISYYSTATSMLYFTIIIDVYSRRIIGWNASDNLLATNNISALRGAFRRRNQKEFPGLIHHSDKGSQYGSTAYRNKLERAQIAISMAENSLENAYAERVIGIIKHEYLDHMPMRTPDQFPHNLKKAITLYNEKRPHIELGYLTPVKFEQKLVHWSKQERPVLKLYDFREEEEIGTQTKGFLRHKPKECCKNKKEAVALKNKTTAQHSIGSDYSSEGCSPAEPSSALSDKTKFKDVN